MTLCAIKWIAVFVANAAPGRMLNRQVPEGNSFGAAHLRVSLGSTVELGIGTAVALHLVVTSNAVTATSDLVGSGVLEDDVITEPFVYDDGSLTVPDGPGFGVRLCQEKVARYFAKDYA